MFASVVCALLVVGVTPAPTHDPNLQCGFHGYCHTEVKGVATNSALRLPDIEIPPEEETLKFVILDKCQEWGREMAGSVVHVCDSDATPTLTMLDHGVGPAEVQRHGSLLNPAYIYMKQYCV